MYQSPNNQPDPNQSFYSDQTSQFSQQQQPPPPPSYPQPGQYSQYPQYPMQHPQKKPWYKRNGWIVLLLIFFFPAGLTLMWVYAPWSKRAKWIVTGIIAAFVVIGGINNAVTAQSTTTVAQPTTAVAPINVAPTHAAQIVVKPTATPAPKPTATPKPTAMPTAPPVVVVQPTRAPAPTAPPVVACSGVIDDGTCYSTNPAGGVAAGTVPADFCTLVTCVSDWNTKQNGSIVQCVNGIYSHSGGVKGACSRDGGVAGALYRH